MDKNVQDKNAKGACMACTCPCDKHKEHNHGKQDEEKEKEKENACKNCGKEHSSCCCGR